MIGHEIGRLCYADACRHDRFTESNDDDQPMSLGEMAHRAQSPFVPCQQSPEVIARQRRDPQQRLDISVRLGGDQEQRRADDDRRNPADNLSPHLVVVATDDPEHHKVDEANGEVTECEHHRTRKPGLHIVECLRQRERRDERRAHRSEQGHLDEALVGARKIAEPRVADPTPPQDRQHENRTNHVHRTAVVGEEVGDTREGKDEDQIEEQFELGY